MRLGFHYHIPAVMDSGVGIRMPGYLGRFIDSLAAHFDKVVCFQHTPASSEAPPEYVIESMNVELVGLGPHSSAPQRLMTAQPRLRPISEWRNELDCFLVRGPTLFLPHITKRAWPMPTALLLVGDWVGGVDALPQPRWRKELIRGLSWWNKRGQDIAAKQSLVFANSRVLFEEYQTKSLAAVETRTTTLSEGDFMVREDACLAPPYHILYAGRFDSAKGLLDIAEALRILRASGLDVVFDLVGWPQKGDDVLQQLEKLCTDARIPLANHGFQTVGPDLFEFYERSDVFVNGSRGAFEGFPRTIWEAMAHSLPVVATGVGSIPEFLDNRRHGLIVPKSNPVEMASAIKEIITNTGLREHIIHEARNVAKENTLERRAREMGENLKDFVRGKS